MVTNPKLHLEIKTETDLIVRDTPTQRILEVRVRAPKAAVRSERPRMNLGLVIDRSGSMSGEKLEFVKKAAQHVVSLLAEGDRAALVSFDDTITVDFPGSTINPETRQELLKRIGQLRSGNMTNLFDGWMTGCKEVAGAEEVEGQINRTLLLTDGLANVGITEIEEIGVHVRELVTRGVSTSTFGVGLGFDEHLLENMANVGSGNFYFIANPQEIPQIFMREFSEMATVTASGVEVSLDLPAQTAAQVFGSWRHEIANGKLRLFLGDLSSEMERVVYIKLLLPPVNEADELVLKAKVKAKDVDGQPVKAQFEVTFRYASADEVERAPRDLKVLEAFATVDLADRTTEALKLERAGQREKAKELMEQGIEELHPYLAQEQVLESKDIANRMSHGMIEEDRKISQSNAYMRKRGR